MLPEIATTADIFSIPKFSVVEQDVSKFIEELKGLKKADQEKPGVLNEEPLKDSTL